MKRHRMNVIINYLITRLSGVRYIGTTFFFYLLSVHFVTYNSNILFTIKNYIIDK